MEIVPQKQTEDLWVNRVNDVVDCSENYHIPGILVFFKIMNLSLHFLLYKGLVVYCFDSVLILIGDS